MELTTRREDRNANSKAVGVCTVKRQSVTRRLDYVGDLAGGAGAARTHNHTYMCWGWCRVGAGVGAALGLRGGARVESESGVGVHEQAESTSDVLPSLNVTRNNTKTYANYTNR